MSICGTFLAPAPPSHVHTLACVGATEMMECAGAQTKPQRRFMYWAAVGALVDILAAVTSYAACSMMFVILVCV